MSNAEIGSLVLTLAVLIGFVHLLGFFFERMKQPRLVGEIFAGVLLGPFVLGHFSASFSERLFGASAGKTEVVLSFIYWIGLFLLMFISGSETRRLMAKENRRETAWLFSVGTALPFCIVLLLGWLSLVPMDTMMGTMAHPVSAMLILAIAVSVTSIPVISRIFIDLKLIKTRFASLILSFAVLEDILLWGILAIATALGSTAAAATENLTSKIVVHIAAAFLYMTVGLTIAPKALRYLREWRFNFLNQASPVAYLFFVLFVYASIAAAMDVNLVFAAFLAGFGIVGGMSGSEREHFSEALDSIARVARGLFIPIYFALVGYKLSLGRDFSAELLIAFLLGSSIIAFTSFSIAALLAGFRGLDVVNLAIVKNARGGPGIVLASVAFDAGIINAPFYTTLVITAVLTSQIAGVWLRFVLSRGWQLLSTNPGDTAESHPRTRVQT